MATPYSQPQALGRHGVHIKLQPFPDVEIGEIPKKNLVGNLQLIWGKYPSMNKSPSPKGDEW